MGWFVDFGDARRLRCFVVNLGIFLFRGERFVQSRELRYSDIRLLTIDTQVADDVGLVGDVQDTDDSHVIENL